MLFSFVALATMFTSRNEGLDVNDPNQYCWKLTASMNGVSETTYAYATGAAISNELEYAKQFGCQKVKWQKQRKCINQEVISSPIEEQMMVIVINHRL